MPRIEHYAFGRVTVDRLEETADVIVLPDRVVRGWRRRDGHDLVLAVLDEVRTGRPLRKPGEVARLELLLAARAPQRRPPREDDQPLLAAELVVVRPRLLTGRELVHAAAEEACAEPAADGRDAVSVSAT